MYVPFYGPMKLLAKYPMEITSLDLADKRPFNNEHRWIEGIRHKQCTIYPKKYAHGFVVLCFVVVMQSFKMNSHEVFIHIHQDCFAGTGAIVRLPQCQWSKPDGYGKSSQCITTTKHSKAKTVCIFIGIYCSRGPKDLVNRRNSAILLSLLHVLISYLRAAIFLQEDW